MFCVVCRDATLLDDSPPRFGGIYEMHANSTADPAFWGERWELYKVRSSWLHCGKNTTVLAPIRQLVMPDRSVHLVCHDKTLWVPFMVMQNSCLGKKPATELWAPVEMRCHNL